MKEKIRKILRKAVGTAILEVSVPERAIFGHYSTNVALRLAKLKGKNPLHIAQEIAEKISKIAPKGFFENVEAAPPGFVNMWLSSDAVRGEFARIASDANYGRGEAGEGKKVIVEYSDPNIAKRMHMGHFRATILGDAIANLYAGQRYRVVRWNYIGDWGTQFGNLIAAYKRWGKKSGVDKAPIETLLALYVRFHREAEAHPSLEEEGRLEFKKLEEGDRENRQLWQWFRKESLKEFQKLYRMLGVRFDVWIGESFFERDVRPTVTQLLQKNIAKQSEGAVVVPLEKFSAKGGLPPALIQKSDGASLYITRDIPNAKYRIKKYKPAKVVYVVGNEQTLHFEQLFAILELLGLRKKAEFFHMKYGLVLGEGGKKLATREGRSVFAEEVVEKAIALAAAIVKKKNPTLSAREKDRVAQAVGIGALKYAILKEHRNSDITFDWKRMLDFTGDSGPYLQYTYARLRSIVRKSQISNLKSQKFKENLEKYLESEIEFALIRKLIEFPDVLREAAENYAVNQLAAYLYALANLANQFYESTPILSARGGSASGGKDTRNARLALIGVVASALKRGLNLLGIKELDKM